MDWAAWPEPGMGSGTVTVTVGLEECLSDRTAAAVLALLAGGLRRVARDCHDFLSSVKSLRALMHNCLTSF